MAKRLFSVFLILLSIQIIIARESGILTVNVVPAVNIPLGSSNALFQTGGGAGINGDYTLPFFPLLFARGKIDFTAAPTTAETYLNLISIGIGPGIQYSVFPSLKLNMSFTGGYALALYGNAPPGGVPFLLPEFQIDFRLSPAFSINGGVAYRYYFSPLEPLYQGISIQLGGGYSIGAEERARIEMKDIRILPVFPVFSKYYDTNPLGQLTVRNGENGVIKDVKITFFIKEYMDSPKDCGIINSLQPGEKRIIPLYALFSNRIMEITEATKAVGEIGVNYSFLEKEFHREKRESVRLYDRNALTWDDNQKAAGFVTTRDPAVLTFSKNSAGVIRANPDVAINMNFRIAAGIFTALKLYGIQYISDPSTSYAELSASKVAVDFIQFPKQTLQYKAGDCDDLSILYCALLESVGIETAFITIPGHIYMAFLLDMDPGEAHSLFAGSEEVIITDNRVWVPVEVTMLESGFYKAWQTGARNWRENHEKDKAGFFPVHTAWEKYEPANLFGVNFEPVPVDTKLLEKAYNDELGRLVQNEIKGRVAEMEKIIRQNRNNGRYMNRLGVLYARFGLFDKAEEQFNKVLQKEQSVSALQNLGNISLLTRNYRKAREYYEKALDRSPGSSSLLVGVMKAYYELGNTKTVAASYEKLKKIDAKIAEKYAYLVSETDTTGRAADFGREQGVSWEED